MINITITSEVPEWFTMVHASTIENNFEINSINEFFKKYYPSETFYIDYKPIIDNVLRMKINTGVECIPIGIFNDDYEHNYVVYGDKIYKSVAVESVDNLGIKYVEKLVEHQNNFKDIKPDLYLNLLDNFLYNNNGRRINNSESYYAYFSNVIIKKFNLSLFIDWYKETEVFKKYSEYISTLESRKKLEMYNLWLKHNIELIKNNNG